MQDQSRKLLEDMRWAVDSILEFARGKTAADYLASLQLRWSIERGFEIIGEAMSQLNKFDSALAARFSEYRKIISFRNVLIHGYSQINNDTTWDIIERDLPVLKRELDELLS